MKITVLSGYGLNCEKETAFAFMECSRKLGIGNIEVKIVHINDIIDNPGELKLSNILAIPGVFPMVMTLVLVMHLLYALKTTCWMSFKSFYLRTS